MTGTPTTETDPTRAVGSPDRPDMPNRMRLKLDLRIHRQRLALRENWMVVDSRRWAVFVRPRNKLLETALRLLRENRMLKERVAELEAASEAVRSGDFVEDVLHRHFLGGVGDWNRDGYGNVDHPLDHDGVVECLTQALRPVRRPDDGEASATVEDMRQAQ